MRRLAAAHLRKSGWITFRFFCQRLGSSHLGFINLRLSFGLLGRFALFFLELLGFLLVNDARLEQLLLESWHINYPLLNECDGIILLHYGPKVGEAIRREIN